MGLTVSISTLEPEQLQVVCTNMAGECLETWSFGVEEMVATLTNQMALKFYNGNVELLTHTGDQVQESSRIKDYTCLTVKFATEWISPLGPSSCSRVACNKVLTYPSKALCP